VTRALQARAKLWDGILAAIGERSATLVGSSDG